MKTTYDKLNKVIATLITPAYELENSTDLEVLFCLRSPISDLTGKTRHDAFLGKHALWNIRLSAHPTSVAIHLHQI
ncbi:MAG TPA: hypothetical protein VKA94_01355 [Hyphomicrobiales bacterium]|nr:hypothetical protein [Hyphomicrobiales bacterium]